MDAGGFPLIEFLHGPLHGPLNGLATLDASSFPNGLLDALGRAWPIAWTGLWMGGLAATILAVVVAGLARTAAMRPATRHALWLAVRRAAPIRGLDRVQARYRVHAGGISARSNINACCPKSCVSSTTTAL